MATADQFYADPSALLKLYLNEPESRAMAIWRARQAGALPVTHHGHVEMVNAIGLAAHRGFLSEPSRVAALAALDDDLVQGRMHRADLHWRAAFRRAAELSLNHTRTLGTRTLDILHVASALELGLNRFVTFDERQAALARAAGLKIVKP